MGAASIRHVSIADPAKAPYGRAAEEAMRKCGLYEGVKSKLVLGDNVMQAGQFVESKAADIGLIPLSLALAPSYKAIGKFAEVPAEAHAPIVQSGVILKGAKDRASAVAFRAFLLRDGKATGCLKRYGYELPRASTL
jgi:molybdate transport system substrate-binding protein